MQIAVSGASGLVGSALCRRLERNGHQVYRLVRESSNSKSPHGRDLTWEPPSGLADPGRLNQIDALVHLAGRSIATGRWTPQEKQLIRDSRVQATEQLVRQILLLDAPPKTIISASAVGIYGDTGDDLVDESSPLGSDFLADIARDWEAACAPLSAAGLRVAHPRFGIILSKDGGALAKMLPLFTWFLGGQLGSGQQYWSWIALEDCIRGLLWLLECQESQGGYNFVSPTPVTNKEFTRILSQTMHRPALLPAPAFGLRLALGQMADALLLSSCRVAPRRLIEEGFQFEYSQLDQFLRTQC
jgi:uncharacterized protein